MNLVKTIQQKKLNDFDEVTPIYKKEYPDAIPSAATEGVSPQKGAIVTHKEVKAAAAAAVEQRQSSSGSRAAAVEQQQQQQQQQQQHEITTTVAPTETSSTVREINPTLTVIIKITTTTSNRIHNLSLICNGKSVGF